MKKLVIFPLFLLVMTVYYTSCTEDQDITQVTNEDKTTFEKNNDITLNQRISKALEQKSLSETGLTWIKVYDLDLEKYIDWETASLPKSYYINFDLEDDIKALYPELLEVRESEEIVLENGEVECYSVKIHGYTQPDSDLPLVILVTGRGLQYDYGNNRWRISIFNQKGTAGIGSGGPHPANPRLCRGGHLVDTWYGLFVYEDTFDFNTYRMKVTFEIGNSPNFPQAFDFIPRCGDRRTISWGTFK